MFRKCICYYYHDEYQVPGTYAIKIARTGSQYLAPRRPIIDYIISCCMLYIALGSLLLLTERLSPAYYLLLFSYRALRAELYVSKTKMICASGKGQVWRTAHRGRSPRRSVRAAGMQRSP